MRRPAARSLGRIVTAVLALAVPGAGCAVGPSNALNGVAHADRQFAFNGGIVTASTVVHGHRARDTSPQRGAETPRSDNATDVTEPSDTTPTVAPPVTATLLPLSAARCPSEMALVDDRVCVDKWEGSLVILDHGKEKALSPFELVDNVSGYRAVSRPNVVPQGYISGLEAERACHASGKRLCTMNEWERGCRGPENLQYPYGNERRAGVCNDSGRANHPVVEAAAKAHIPKDKMWTLGMNLASINQLPDSLLPTGEKAECVTPEGLFDMVGNLHEWVADADGTFRGGYYMDTSQNGEGCSYRTSAHDFDYHDYSTGFRCCADPDSIE